MKPIFFTFLFFQITILSIAQSNFTLKGRTNLLSNGIAVLVETAPEIFYETKITQDSSIIQNGFFLFKGIIKEPQLYRIKIVNKEFIRITETFFIEKGKSIISIDSSILPSNVPDFGCGVLIEGSKINFEYFKVFWASFKDLNKRLRQYFDWREKAEEITDTILKNEMLQKMQAEKPKIVFSRDSIFESFVRKKSNSKILHWVLYKKSLQTGYREVYDKIFTITKRYNSNKINNFIDLYLSSQRSSTSGNVFPLLSLIKDSNYKETYKTDKFTLVEFWFSKCSPCLAQFDVLKEIYSNYKNEGFEVVAISSDSYSSIKNYNFIIESKKYKWKNILDTNGIKSESINVVSYPTNYLLDENYKIIAKNVNMETLKSFLKENL